MAERDDQSPGESGTGEGKCCFPGQWISEFKVMQWKFSTYLTKISSLSMRKNVYDVWTTDEKESLKILIELAFLMESKIQEDLHGSYDGI